MSSWNSSLNGVRVIIARSTHSSPSTLRRVFMPRSYAPAMDRSSFRLDRERARRAARRARSLSNLKEDRSMAGAYDRGMKTRRKVLGDEWVDRAMITRTPFNEEFQELITRYAWDEIWNRPGIAHPVRRMIVIAQM